MKKSSFDNTFKHTTIRIVDNDTSNNFTESLELFDPISSNHKIDHINQLEDTEDASIVLKPAFTITTSGTNQMSKNPSPRNL